MRSLHLSPTVVASPSVERAVTPIATLLSFPLGRGCVPDLHRQMAAVLAAPGVAALPERAAGR